MRSGTDPTDALNVFARHFGQTPSGTGRMGQLKFSPNLLSLGVVFFIVHQAIGFELLKCSYTFGSGSNAWHWSSFRQFSHTQLVLPAGTSFVSQHWPDKQAAGRCRLSASWQEMKRKVLWGRAPARNFAPVNTVRLGLNLD